jgi:hypothetical protein
VLRWCAGALIVICGCRQASPVTSPQPPSSASTTTQSSAPLETTQSSAPLESTPIGVTWLGKASPESAKVGESVAVSPASEVRVECQNTAGVYLVRGDGLTIVGYLGLGGYWQPIPGPGSTLPPPTLVACPGSRSSNPVTYVIPPTMAAGNYVICLDPTFNTRLPASPLDPSCAAVTVSPS